MSRSSTASPRGSRRVTHLTYTMIFASVLTAGCGEAGTNQTNIPADFAATLEKEHPELFIKKTGKGKTEVLGGRDKRDIIRREWLKSQGHGD